MRLAISPLGSPCWTSFLPVDRLLHLKLCFLGRCRSGDAFLHFSIDEPALTTNCPELYTSQCPTIFLHLVLPRRTRPMCKSISYQLIRASQRLYSPKRYFILPPGAAATAQELYPLQGYYSPQEYSSLSGEYVQGSARPIYLGEAEARLSGRAAPCLHGH